jgi:AraC-like DNA-binding protein
MAVSNDEQGEREVLRIQAKCEELVERIGSVMREDGAIQPLPGLFLFRYSAPGGPMHSVVEAAVNVIAQGSKEVLLGERRYRYDPSRYLLTTIDLPRISHILAASRERPYLGLRLQLTPALVSSVLLEASHTLSNAQATVSAIDVSPLDGKLLDAFVWLVGLLDEPSEAPVLLPLVTREIAYCLLKGEQGARLRHLAILGGTPSSITRAVTQIRQHLDQPLSIEDLARELGMSVSRLHHHFKAVTAMSPLQFQKQLRLQEARRLMLDEDLDAAHAAYRVGYHDASHFNREYKSFFGVPPMRDVQRLREGHSFMLPHEEDGSIHLSYATGYSPQRD